MEIEKKTTGEHVELLAQGRLDASWCEHVSEVLSATLKDGYHSIGLDLAAVTYISSAGIRVLISYYKQLQQIGGRFCVTNPSTEVRSVLELAGLAALLGEKQAIGADASAATVRFLKQRDERFEYLSAQSCGDAPYTLRVVGDVKKELNASLFSANPRLVAFTEKFMGLGLGALAVGDDGAGCVGELLGISGTAAVLSADSNGKPDYLVSEQALVPKVRFHYGLLGYGELDSFCRFSATDPQQTIKLSELAANFLEYKKAEVGALAVVAETASLVGAALKRPFQDDNFEASLQYPMIREHLAFTAERVYANTCSLVVGFCGRREALGDRLITLFRPLDAEQKLWGHFHAAVFSYVPVKKGVIELKPTVESLFNYQSLLKVLHLLGDYRETQGIGESEFMRGALWGAVAKVV